MDDLKEFKNNIKVLRLYKIGEPLVNKNIAKMIRYAKDSGKVNFIDMTTNASLLNEKLSLELVESGLNKINISIEGVNSSQYKKYANVDINYDQFVENIKFLHKNKGDLEITIKIPSNYITEEDKKLFFETFSDYCDRIFIENLTSVWSNFDINSSSNVLKNIEDKTQYGLEVKNKKVCTYLFYSIVINSTGTVSPCCSDWQEKMIIGNVNNQTVREIWNSEKLKELRIQHLTGHRDKNPICVNCGNIKYAQIDNIDDYADAILTKNLLRKYYEYRYK
ncbi:SPASM domain-containing protein [Brachyspira hyodysenteriae]|nr:SPASM domain-containing protein [Brachyspira hyodysenteriae]